MKHSVRLLRVLALLLVARPALSQILSGEELVKALRQGGYVLVMRHASSPAEAPAKPVSNPDNVNAERQLDENGRTTATAMGKALRDLMIPIGDVYTSPTYRALETVRLAQFPNAQKEADLGDGGRSMQGVAEAQSSWLKTRATQFPQGTNTIIVTHLPNIVAAFPQWAEGLSEGEALVLGSDGKTGVTMVAKVKIEQWQRMRF